MCSEVEQQQVGVRLISTADAGIGYDSKAQVQTLLSGLCMQSHVAWKEQT